MKTILAVLLTVAVLAPAGWATHERITEARIAKIERRLEENYRRDYIRGRRFLDFRQLVRHCVHFRRDSMVKTSDGREAPEIVAVFPMRRSCVDPSDGFFRGHSGW
jgi:hypothetical protein